MAQSTTLLGWLVLVVATIGGGACAKDPRDCSTMSCSTADGRPVEVDAGPFDYPRIEALPEDDRPVVCGDGFRGVHEECDDGNVVSDDGCTADCRLEQRLCPQSNPSMFCDARPVTCGDGVRATNELCDDANQTAGDGCAADCMMVEPGWHCRVAGRRCVPICGDLQLQGGETCDDGNAIDGDGCSSTCLVESGVSLCGNGIIDGDEECDAGANNLDGEYDGCTSACLFGPHCGDAQLDLPFEACDLGPDNVAIYGAGCTRACRSPPACGDGKVDTAFGELCDLGALNDQPLMHGCTPQCVPLIN